MKNENICDFIVYGLNENDVDINSIEPKIINIITQNYFNYCNEFKFKYIKGELDTFKKAACLLVAINNSNISLDKKTNALIAIDASQKMCEKPYWNVGPNANIPYKMEEVDFKSLFETQKYFYDKHRIMLTEALMYKKGVEPISVYMNLELFYRVAIKIKKSNTNVYIDSKYNIPTYQQENNIQEENKTTEPTSKRKFFSLFKK